MKKRALVSLVLLVSILMVMAETVVFQEDPTDPVSHCVDGNVYVYNPETGQWDQPNMGETVSVKIYKAANPGMYQQYDFPTISHGYYISDFSGLSNSSEYDTARVIFRGQSYMATFNYSTGTTIDIWFYPDR
jgi:hypothetical protein